MRILQRIADGEFQLTREAETLSTNNCPPFATPAHQNNPCPDNDHNFDVKQNLNSTTICKNMPILVTSPKPGNISTFLRIKPPPLNNDATPRMCINVMDDQTVSMSAPEDSHSFRTKNRHDAQYKVYHLTLFNAHISMSVHPSICARNISSTIVCTNAARLCFKRLSRSERTRKTAYGCMLRSHKQWQNSHNARCCQRSWTGVEGIVGYIQYSYSCKRCRKSH